MYKNWFREVLEKLGIPIPFPWTFSIPKMPRRWMPSPNSAVQKMSWLASSSRRSRDSWPALP